MGALIAILLLPFGSLTSIANKCAADLSARGQLDQLNHLLRRGTRFALLLGLLVALGLMALSPALSLFLRVPSPHLLVILSLGTVLAFAAPINYGSIQGRQQFGWFALVNFTSAFLRVATAAVALLLGFGIEGLLIASVVYQFVLYGVTFVPLRDVLRGPQSRIQSYKPLLSYSLGTTLAVVGASLLGSTDTVLVKHFLSPVDAGYYAALVKIAQTVLFVGGSFVQVMFPKVAALKQQGRPYRAVLGWTLTGVVGLSSCVLVIFWLFPSQIITLIFHAPTAVSAQLFWYGLAMMCYAPASVLMYYFLSLGNMRFVPVLLACCAIQAGLIMVWHESIAQVVMVMVFVMALLLCAFAALYMIDVIRSGAKRAGAPAG
jgi:O-antigen/teichoic acid export membrane protein